MFTFLNLDQVHLIHREGLRRHGGSPGIRDHGLIESTQTADGLAMAYSAKLFDVAADWIKEQRLPAAGKFIQMPSARLTN